jgi:hypothetical protein
LGEDDVIHITCMIEAIKSCGDNEHVKVSVQLDVAMAWN